jgi:ABC-2 type transport system permease protein
VSGTPSAATAGAAHDKASDMTAGAASIAAAGTAEPAFAVRKGVRRWLHGYRVMLRWELGSLRLLVPLIVAIQTLAGAGFAVGIGLYRQMSPGEAMYLASGTAVITLILVGMILGPQLIAQQKTSGAYEFLWSLPLPRTAAAAAWATIAIVIGLPGMAAAVAVAAWRYHLAFHYGPSLAAAVLLTAATASLIGYALGHAIGNSLVTMVATQFLSFGIIGFSPVNLPADRLPAWLAHLHEWLPFGSMATVVRGSLAPDLVTGVGHAYLVLAFWMVGMIVVNAVVLGRRG